MPLILKTNGTEHLRLLPSGELGIGTSTPQYPLDVAGNLGVSDTAFLSTARISELYLQNGTQAKDRILVSDAQGKGDWKPFDQLAHWKSSGSDLYYPTPGKVGIGTKSPQRMLDVAGDALVRDKLYVQKGIEIGKVLEVDSSETRIKSSACVTSGRFGIGTGSPGERLAVQGNARIHGKTMTDSLEVYGRTEFSYATFDSLRVGDSSIVIGANTSYSGNTIDTDHESLTLNPTGSGEIHTGNVGVGALSPEKKLHVKATHVTGIVVDPEPNDPPVFEEPDLGDIIGDHAGIRLENETYSNDGNTLLAEVKWDIQPKISSSSQDFLAFTKPSFSNGDPLLALKGNRRAVVNGRLLIRRDAKNHLTLVDPDNGNGNGYGINFNMRDQLDGVNGGTISGGVAHVRASGDPQAMVLGIYNHWDRSIVIHRDGQVGIGTKEVIDDHQLSVKGSMIANEVVVEEAWSDHVFDEGYRLPSLQEEKDHIQATGHLKDVPSEERILREGLSLGDLTRIQQREIEEVYLHLFEMKEMIRDYEQAKDKRRKRIQELRRKNRHLKNVVKELKKQNALLKKKTR